MPHSPAFQLPELPPAFLDTLAAIARAKFGAAAPEGEVLSAAVRRASLRYTKQRDSLLDPGPDPATLCARLRYFLPRDLHKVWGPLLELQAHERLPGPRSHLDCLDLGAGLGATTLGLGSFFAAHRPDTSLRIDAVDADARALQLYDEVLTKRQHLRVVPLMPRSQQLQWGPKTRPPGGPYDLIVLGLSLNEMLLATPEEQRADAGLVLLSNLAEHLRDDGCILVLEPALREPSRTLQQIRDAIVASQGPLHVFGPCLGSPTCPLLTRPRDWCHERLPARFPLALRELSRDASLREEDLTFSYLSLRKDPAGRLPPPNEQLYRIVGGPVRSKGKLEFDLCGAKDAPRLQRLSRHSPFVDEEDPLAEVGRGTVLTLTDVQRDGSNRLRVTPDTHIQLRQHWSRTDANTDSEVK